MLIGELARRSQTSAKTLRFYEQAGVLAAPKRTPGGYRDYPHDALDRLAFIAAAQTAGLTLAEIRRIIGLRDDGIAPCGHVVALLDEKAANTKRQMAALLRLSAELEQLRVQARKIDPGTCDPRRVCEALAPSPAPDH